MARGKFGLHYLQKEVISNNWIDICGLHFGNFSKMGRFQKGGFYASAYTIAEITYLFVDIKHMRPVTENPVADLTFLF